MERKKQPEMRFKGFQGDWEKRKLSDFLEVSTEKNIDNIYDKNDVLSVSGDYGIVNQIEFQGRSFAGEVVSNYGVVHTGDIVYTKSPLKANPYGIIKTNKGKAGIVSTLYAIYHNKANANSNFVQTYFEQNSRMNHYMKPLVNKGAKNDMKVSAENAIKGLVYFPSFEEQNIITENFAILDKTINLYQQEYDKLQLLKKSMLQKMFPRNGAKVPEMRFKGFTGDWEEQSLKDITVKIGSGKTPLGGENSYVDTGIILIRSQNVKNNRVELNDVVCIDELTDKSMENSRVYANDVLLNITGASIGRSAVYREVVHANVNQHVCIIRPNEGYNQDFIQLNLISTNGQHQIDISQAGGGREGLNFQQIGKMTFYFPTLMEQERIGNYFNNIDELINLQQEEIDKLKLLKKSLLQKMFV